MFNRNEIVNPAGVPSRTHYPWHQLEEYRPKGGMWATPPTLSRGYHAEAAGKLMADPPAFRAAMLRVLDEWPKSTDNAMSTPGLNRRAWIGHAGCFLATGSPEETTRIGWHQLDDAEQAAANEAADQAIFEWRRRRAIRIQVDQLAFGTEWDA